MMKSLGRPGGLLAMFAVLSLIAVATGVIVTAAKGAPVAAWGGNLGAWAVGALLAFGIYRFLRPGWVTAVLLALPLGLAVTFLGADQGGVHRWLDAGPVHVNMAMLLLPASIVALSFLAFETRWPWISALVALALLALQPDGSQATTLAAAAVLVAYVAVKPPLLRIGIMVAAVGLAVFAWTRPDALQPIPEVEGVVGLALALNPLAGAAAIFALVAVAAAPLIVTFTNTTRLRVASMALSLCFLLWAVMPMIGHFPVPLVGIGMGPILGAWLGVGLLAAVLRPEIFTKLN